MATITITNRTRITNARMANQDFVNALTKYVTAQSYSGIRLLGEGVPGENFDLWIGGGAGNWNMTVAQLVRQWDAQVKEWDNTPV